MKKTFILVSALLFLIASTVHGQITQTNTQFPNPGFEKCSDHNCSTAQGTDTVPDNWHTFDEIKYDTYNLFGSEATAKKTSHFLLRGNNAYGGNGISLQLAAHNAAGIALANGTITSGRTRVGSLSVSDCDNYNFSQLTVNTQNDYYPQFGNHKWYWDFIGCPDSMSFYYKTNWTTPQNKPLIKVYLHRGEWYDHACKVVNSSSNSDINDTTNANLIAYCQTSFAPSSSWRRFAGKFIHYDNNSSNNDNNYSTIIRPQYILASFSTNENAGGGTSNDRLSIDELWCIYDKGLESVSIGGTANSAALNTFNAAEYATHEPSRTYDASGNPTFNNSGSVTWTYRIAIPCNDIPQVSATPKSKLISQFTIMQAVPQNDYKATIYVKHNDNSEFYYYIQFTPDLPTITLNNGGTYTACADEEITVTASGASNYSWSNGLGSGATVHPTVSGTYTVTGTASNGCISTATATVTINAIPTAPTLSIINDNGCAVHNGTITVINPIVGYTYTLGNEASGTVFSGLEEGPYTVTVQDGNGCTNSATATISHVQSTVTATASANTPCAGSDLMLTATSGTVGVSYSWSGPNGFTSTEQNPIIDSASAALEGEYTVTVTDTTTLCSVTETVYVTVNQPTTGIDEQTACGEFTWIDNNTYYESTNEPTFTIENGAANGCDSIVTLNLIINQPATGVDEQTACGEFTWIDSVTYTESTNEPTFTIENGAANGCDSIVTLNLTINQTVHPQVITLNSGATWVSFDVEITLADLKAALVAAAPGTSINIYGQSNNTYYDPARNRWVGNLTWDVAKMFMIKVTTDCEITLEGMPINPADHTVTIVSGNNYLGFPFNQTKTLTDAFAGFAVNGDKVYSQTGSAQYTRGRWQGSTLTELQPGKGYIYKSSTSESRTFVFPVSSR